MTRLQALATVVDLALEIEDRDKREQKAILAIAHSVDSKLNRQSITNPDRDLYFLNPSRRARLAGCNGCRACDKRPDRSVG